MITELRIADLGVISDATISLHPGLTVVTGETGAGKTMIVSGLGLLLGGRADPRSVRRGVGAGPGGRPVQDRRILSCCSACSDAGGELDDDELIVARHVTSAGRSRAYVGGAQVPAQRLRGADCRAGHDTRPGGAGTPHRGRPATAAPGSLRRRRRPGTACQVLRASGRRIARARTELAKLRAEAQRRARRSIC